MNEFGEPNMGNPSVRFDEGRESVGHWPRASSIRPLLPTLLISIYDLRERRREFASFQFSERSGIDDQGRWELRRLKQIKVVFMRWVLISKASVHEGDDVVAPDAAAGEGEGVGFLDGVAVRRIDHAFVRFAFGGDFFVEGGHDVEVVIVLGLD